MDRSEVFRNPIAAAADGYLYTHEDGIEADGEPMAAFVESYDMELGSGDYLMRLRRFVPDFKSLTGMVDFSFRYRRYPAKTQRSKGPFRVSASTGKFNPRFRARQAAVRLESCTDVPSAWRLGTMRADVKMHGKR